jgi:hypothetical protein
MMTFISILFILIGVNAIMMIFSLNVFGQRDRKSSNSFLEDRSTNIYPIDLVASKYKKAV